jgi:mycothiol synthase
VHTSSPRHEHLGEVYAVAVDPKADLRGLGSALVVAGLAHLRTRGLTQVLLYVDASNERAIGLYERLGFTIWDSDVQYSALP